MSKSTTPPGHKRLQCIVTLEQYERLRAIGFEKRTPVVELVRRAIDSKYPARKGAKP